jgi:hypothetical protein
LQALNEPPKKIATPFKVFVSPASLFQDHFNFSRVARVHPKGRKAQQKEACDKNAVSLTVIL